MNDNYNIKYIATGHYCRVQYSYDNDDDVNHNNHFNNNHHTNGSSYGFNGGVNKTFDHHHHHQHKVQLLRGIDSYKDQSYFLSLTTVSYVVMINI